MKQLVLLVLSFFILWSVGGCQNADKQNVNNSHELKQKEGIEVIVANGGKFPENLAGIWIADAGSWELEFEPDGKIASAVVSLGAVEMKPGQVTEFPTRYGGRGIFKPGLWQVQYWPDSRELLVKIVIEDFYQDLGQASMEGNITDIIKGPVSDDGKHWKAEWFSFGRYVATIPGRAEPNEFYNVSEPENRGTLTFTKKE